MNYCNIGVYSSVQMLTISVWWRWWPCGWKCVKLVHQSSVISSYNILVLLFREGDYEELIVNYEKRIKCICIEKCHLLLFCCGDVIIRWYAISGVVGGESAVEMVLICAASGKERKVPQLVIWNVVTKLMMMTRKGSSCDCVGVVPQFGFNINSCVFCSVPKRINQLFNRSSVWVRGNIYRRSNLWRDNENKFKCCYDQILYSYLVWKLSSILL